MALRIIRKSASQNQVEIIKGTREETPLISLLFFVENAAQRDALSAFIQEQSWIQEHAQCLIMKAHTLKESLRSHFTAMHHTLKLLNEPKQHSWSARLQAFLSEAEADWSVFIPQLDPEVDLEALCQAYLQWIPHHPNTALLAPPLYQAGQVFAAGQMLSDTSIPPHSLHIASDTLRVKPEKALYYFYQGLSSKAFEPFSQGKFLQSEATPLPFSAIQREAYLEAAEAFNDKSNTWDLSWLAQALAQQLGILQYRIGLIPHPLSLQEDSLALLTPSALPEDFPTPYQGTEHSTCFTLYKRHGLQQKGTRFAYLHPESKG